MSLPQTSLENADLPVPSATQKAIATVWQQIGEPGATLDAQERVRLAAIARMAPNETPLLDHDPLGFAAHTIAHDAHHIDEDWVTSLFNAGVPEATYVEVCGLVCRLVAIDTYVRAVGVAPLTLPTPVDGDPTGVVSDQAKPGKAFVATEGPPSALTALSLIPAETAARKEIHAPLYLSTEQMADNAHEDLLTRAQMELIASRTSWLNHCQY